MKTFDIAHEPGDVCWAIWDQGIRRVLIQKVLVEILNGSEKVSYMADTGREIVPIKGEDLAATDYGWKLDNLRRRYVDGVADYLLTQVELDDKQTDQQEDAA